DERDPHVKEGMRMKNQDCMYSKKSTPTPILRRCLNLVFPHRSNNDNTCCNVKTQCGPYPLDGAAIRWFFF
ncbi:MAG: hypothetical protein LAT83_17710, partial [Kiritimatiellae bacterium]|nr:hypothetical protein [Kiritimatiellia bacterium]